MIYKVIYLCLAAASGLAAPVDDVIPLDKDHPHFVPIVSQMDELEPNGTYRFSYETGDGTKREETSYDKIVPKPEGRSVDGGEENSDESDEIHVQQGSYSYVAPDGTVVSVKYIADENGFRPVGSHIPRLPDFASSGEQSDNSIEKSGSSKQKSGKSLDAAQKGAPIDVRSGKPAAPPALAARSAGDSENTQANNSGASSSTEADAAKDATEATSESTKEDAATTEAASSTTEAGPSTTEAGPSTTEAVPSTTEADSSSTTEKSETSTTAASTTEATEESSTPEGKSEATQAPTEATTAAS